MRAVAPAARRRGIRLTSRRAFFGTLTGGLFAASRIAEAQQTKVYRIGYLGPSSATVVSRFTEAFRQGLRELGWVEGQNILIEYRFADGQFDRLPDLAAELVRLKVDVIVAIPTHAAVAAKNATATIPIVMANVADPVGLGLSSPASRVRTGT
jgi:putative ABC transport system substrate-binding protein